METTMDYDRNGRIILFVFSLVFVFVLFWLRSGTPWLGIYTFIAGVVIFLIYLAREGRERWRRGK